MPGRNKNLIKVEAEMQELQADPNRKAKGTVIEAKLVIHWAIKGIVPNKYSNHMKQSIIRLRPDIELKFGNNIKSE